ncbi:Tudor/PWWP/MBT [Rickenella mellea]|uniref:Tudor/PWWP/MBT n=1 Tax=Rickenella mellea TaxID=50990 RepID=A0A4Y7QAI8_9AGAM|nr:Tudor/PWWP/MBT [Rickenella mellea]
MSKKSTTKSKEEQTYEFRDVVLAKIRGFPSWPAMIVDPESVPVIVKKEQPTGKKNNFYCVKFFPAGDYSWVLTKDLSRLRKHEIESYIAEPHKKSGDLLSGYRIALDPEKWEKELEERQVDAQEEQADAEVDELAEEDDDADADEEAPVKTKKRKRESEAGAKSKPKAKKDKEKSSEPAGRKRKGSTAEKAEKGGKGRKNGTKSKAVVESEDEGDRAGGDNAGPSKVSPTPAKKVKRDKDGEEADPELDNDPEALKVKEWRHKLQRGFLTKSPPKEEDMGQYDTIFSTVEEFDMDIKYLQFSKIGKVMRHIAALEVDKIPRDGEFKFKDRAQALVNKWHQTIAVKPSTTTANGTNGTVEGNADMDVDKTGEGKKDVDMKDAPAEGDLTMSEMA